MREEYVKCPYCGKKNELEGYTLDMINMYTTHHDHECDFCKKNFRADINIDITFTTRKLECLNGGKHDLFVKETDNPMFSHRFVKRKLYWLSCRNCYFEQHITKKLAKQIKKDKSIDLNKYIKNY